MENKAKGQASQNWGVRVYRRILPKISLLVPKQCYKFSKTLIENNETKELKII